MEVVRVFFLELLRYDIFPEERHEKPDGCGNVQEDPGERQQG